MRARLAGVAASRNRLHQALQRGELRRAGVRIEPASPGVLQALVRLIRPAGPGLRPAEPEVVARRRAPIEPLAQQRFGAIELACPQVGL